MSFVLDFLYLVSPLSVSESDFPRTPKAEIMSQKLVLINTLLPLTGLVQITPLYELILNYVLLHFNWVLSSPLIVLNLHQALCWEVLR